jgi:hypothetical protein
MLELQWAVQRGFSGSLGRSTDSLKVAVKASRECPGEYFPDKHKRDVAEATLLPDLRQLLRQ